MDCSELFKGKHITLMGLGMLGRGVGDAEFLAQCGAEVLVTDIKSEEELAESVARLKKYPNITFKLGGHDVGDFTQCDLVVKAAGVPLDSPEIAAARTSHVPVVMSTALFAKYAMEAGVQIVGVTGTRGKSSVTHMIFHALKQAGRPAILGGNVRNISTLAMLPQVKAGDIAVLELDSWQLQGFGDLRISPNISLFTNFMPDHLNYYGAAQVSDTGASRAPVSEPSKPNERSEYKGMDTYFADKANVFRHQKAGDLLFVGASVLEPVQAAQPVCAPSVPASIPADWKLKVVGEHNRENASLAAAALESIGLSQEEIKTGLKSFEPVEGRLQFIAEVHGVKVYNDNNATTPEATVAALSALGKNITLIAGGSEKGLPLDGLVSAIKQTVSHVILLTHPQYKGSERLAEQLQKEDIAFEKVTDLDAALDTARAHTTQGTILFSPAFTSFGMFKNEYERNDEFLKLVRTASAS